MKKVYHIDATNTRTVLGVESAVWDDPEKTSITCKILFEEFAVSVGYMSFTAYKFDSMAHGREIFNDIAAETWGVVEEYKDVQPEQLPAE
ncbi:tail fiber assembly protein [Vibrio phage vB_VspS_VS-ABTNL-3]|nr:tail fiber assembly protein [Vibrio phage vB_VspS_VS-ABTNL-3]